MNRKERRAQARDKRPPAPSRAPAADIEALFVEAVRLHETGRLPEAEQLYRRILAQAPEHAAALHTLGLIARQGGDNPHQECAGQTAQAGQRRS